MKVTYPQMGNVNILIEDLLGRLDVDFLTPPPSSLNTIRLGVRHAPELACFPLKVTLGNFIEGLEAGADTCIMVGGVGPCRFGYYAETQRRILHQLGYKVPMIILEPPLAQPVKFYKSFKQAAPKKSLLDLYRALKVSWKKARFIEMIDKVALQIRCFENKKGQTTKARRKAVSLLSNAFLEKEIEDAYREAVSIMKSIPVKEYKAPKIGIVGEFFILLEPFVNFNCEEILGNMGFYLEKAVYLTDWLSPTKKALIAGHSLESVNEAAMPYLSHFVGGDGRQTIGHTIIYAKEGFDGILHLFPFTCMPELIAKSILPRISNDLDIPVLSIVFDEQTGKAGLLTRLEAFADLIQARLENGIHPKREVIDWVLDEKIAVSGGEKIYA